MSLTSAVPAPPSAHGPVRPAGSTAAAVKEAGFFALVALLLSLPMIGVRLTGQAQMPPLDRTLPEMGKVFLIVLLTFLARLIVRAVTGSSALPVFIVAGIFTASYALPWLAEHIATLLTGLPWVGSAFEAAFTGFAGFWSVLGTVIGAPAALFDGVLRALVQVVTAPFAGGINVQPDAPSMLFLGFGFFAAVTLHAGLLLRARRRARLGIADKAPVDEDAAELRRRRISQAISWGAIALAVLLPILYPDRRSLDIAILIATYVMLGWGLNIVVGLAGLLDLGYVAFYAVGAYAYALLALHFDIGFWLCLPLAGILAAFSGFLLGLPVLRLRGDYFAIVTLGFGEIIRLVLINWVEVTNGPNGLSTRGTPLTFFGLAEFSRTPSEAGLPLFHEMFGMEFSTIHRLIFLYYVILVLALLVNLFTLRIRRLPLGRAWEALREDDIACMSLGIDRTAIKLAAFTIAAAFGGFAGSFFAVRQGFISPESFTFIESAIILAIVVLGGMGSQTGVVVATLLVIGLPEWFRELEDYRMMAFGLGMVLIMVWRPHGLVSHREPSIRLPKEYSDATSTPPPPGLAMGSASAPS